MKQYVIGIDVGGTNVRLGLVGAGGGVVARNSFSTKKFSATPQQLTRAMCDAVHALLSDKKLTRAGIEGVGIGLPGLVDTEKGVVRMLPNIPGWKDVPLAGIMEKALGIPVMLDNDVNMIALGEWKFGAGRGFKDMICMTLGTGVGAGLILGGAIYRGPGFVAGEIGHMPFDQKGPECGCGGWGCFERYVGHQHLQNVAAEFFGKPGISLEQVYDKALHGKKKALKFWDMAGERVGNGLVGPVNLLNPEVVIIGGGVSRSFSFFESAIVRTLRRRAMRTQAEMVRIIKAQLDDDAGIIGARVLLLP